MAPLLTQGLCFFAQNMLSALLIIFVLTPASADALDIVPDPILPQKCHRKPPEPKINTALLTIVNDESLAHSLVVSLQSEQCYKCDLMAEVEVESNCTLRVDSRWPTKVRIQIRDGDKLKYLSESCNEGSLTRLYTEGSSYSIYLRAESTSMGNVTCDPATLHEAADPFIPIYVALGIGFFLVVLWTIGKYLYRKGYVHRVLCFWSTESMMSDLGTPTNISQINDASPQRESNAPAKERLRSLDTFRGISIVIMIFVNYGGGKYWFFKHSKWNGLTFADLVFPWFVYIMGTAMAFSFQGQLRRSVPKWQIFMKIVKRSIILFLLGLLINSFGVEAGVDFDTFRVPGVLQRFAGTYLIVATTFLFLAPASTMNQHSRFAAFRDIFNYWPEWVINLSFIALHTGLTMAMPVPGCPRGYLGPGGLENHGKYFNCTGGASGYIDRKIFGDAHMYGHPTSMEVYKSNVPYDPEGLLGTLNSCVLCFLGLQAGKILLLHTDWVKRCRRFFVWAIVLTALGTLLCEASLNEGWIPINKNLWSLSFVFINAGMAFFLLLVCYLLTDVYKVWSGGPFHFAGMNSIALYCGHEFFDGRAPVSFVVPNTHASLLALNIWGTTFWVLVSVYFFYKGIFISV